MAKRMKFSVVGLPHYTIWHLYEPSVDDIRHMEEMEKERKEKEAEEEAKKAKIAKVKQSFRREEERLGERTRPQCRDMVQQAKKEEKAKADHEEEGCIGGASWPGWTRRLTPGKRKGRYRWQGNRRHLLIFISGTSSVFVGVGMDALGDARSRPRTSPSRTDHGVVLSEGLVRLYALFLGVW